MSQLLSSTPHKRTSTFDDLPASKVMRHAASGDNHCYCDCYCDCANGAGLMTMPPAASCMFSLQNQLHLNIHGVS